MKLRNRLAFFTISFFGILFSITIAIIYFLFRNWALQNEQNNLNKTALVAAVYYLEQDEQSHTEHENVTNELRRLISRQNIAVYNSRDEVAYGRMTGDINISAAVLERIRKDHSYFLELDDYFYFGIYYKDNQGDFVVVIRESSYDFRQHLHGLLYILISVFAVSLLCIFIFARYMGKWAYRPILEFTEKIKQQDSAGLSHPVHLERSYEELDALVDTYNTFINTISQTFTIQKNFIDYVSHELRTPLTAMLGTLEVTGSRPRNEQEYQEAFRKLVACTYSLESTIDNMLILSGARTRLEFQPLHIDEIIWNCVTAAMDIHKAQIHVDIQVKDPALLRFNGNMVLLELAVNNIIENALKYSDYRDVSVKIYLKDDKVTVSITDSGIGIAEEDIRKVTQNFYRGGNVSKITGKGIGLSLSSIIFKLHQIDMGIRSSGDGTCVEIVFP